MTLAKLIRGKSESVELATATPATVATLEAQRGRSVAKVATVAVANPANEKAEVLPYDAEAWAERAGVAEFDGGLSREEAEALAWREDDRRRCQHCLNLSKVGTCTVASPGGPVSARRGYEPIPDILRRCEGYRPNEEDPDQRPGAERWPGLQPVLEGAA